MEAMENALRGLALKELAKQICDELILKDFIIYRYDAYSTNSIYLKLDFGVCNSIRIGDHNGKKMLKYRYNIGSHIKEKGYKMDKYPRFYFPAGAVEDMLEKICKDRANKIERYGQERYEQFMIENQKDHANSKGFWRDAYRVL